MAEFRKRAIGLGLSEDVAQVVSLVPVPLGVGDASIDNMMSREAAAREYEERFEATTSVGSRQESQNVPRDALVQERNNQLDDSSDSISFQSDRSEAYHERKALQLSERFHGQCPDRSNNDRDSDSNPVSSPVSGPNLSEMLETRPAVEPTVVDDTQDVKSPTTKVFIITPLGHQDFFHLSARTRGLDIVREKGCLVRWEASSLYLTHHTNVIAMFSNILEEAPEIKEGDTLLGIPAAI